MRPPAPRPLAHRTRLARGRAAARVALAAVVLVGLVAGSGGDARGEDAPPAPTVPSTAPTPFGVWITGRVVGDDGQPVVEARVSPVAPDAPAAMLVLEDRLAGVRTDRDGRFRLFAASPDVDLAVSADAYLSAWCRGPHGAPGTDVVLRREVDAWEGTVADEAGVPIAGARVALVPVAPVEGPMLPCALTRADARGRFRLPRASGGGLWTVVAAASGRSERAMPLPADAAPPATAIVLGAPTVATLTVVDAATGAALDGAVCAVGGLLTPPTLSAADGQARLAVPVGWDGTLHVAATGHAPADWSHHVAAGTAARTLALGRVLLPPLETMAGRVLDARGAPVAGARLDGAGGVVAYAASDGTFRLPRALRVAGPRNRRSEFELRRVGASAAGFSPAVATGSSYAPIELRLAPPVEVAGRVTMPDGTGARGAFVALRLDRTLDHLSLSAVPDALAFASVAVDADGRYAVRGLAPGLYEATAWLPGRVATALRRVVVAATGSTPLDLALPSGVEVLGAVRDAGGQPRAGVVVELRAAGGGVARTVTAGDGTFLFADVEERAATLRVVADGFRPASVDLIVGAAPTGARAAIAGGGGVVVDLVASAGDMDVRFDRAGVVPPDGAFARLTVRERAEANAPSVEVDAAVAGGMVRVPQEALAGPPRPERRSPPAWTVEAGAARSASTTLTDASGPFSIEAKLALRPASTARVVDAAGAPIGGAVCFDRASECGTSDAQGRVRARVASDAGGGLQAVAAAHATVLGANGQPSAEPVLAAAGALRGAAVADAARGPLLDAYVVTQDAAEKLWLGVAVVAPDGTFVIEGLPAGPASIHLMTGEAMMGNAGAGVPVVVVAGRLTDVLAPLPLPVADPATSVAGVIVDERGAPVVGVEMCFSGAGRGTTNATHCHQTTDVLGRFTIADVAPAEYQLWPSPPPGVDLVGRATGLKPGARDVRVVMSRPVVATARVVGADGVPVGGATVLVLQSEEGGFGGREVRTSWGGYFQVAVSARPFDLVVAVGPAAARRSFPAPSRSGAVLRLGDLRLATASVVTGRVRLAGGKAAGKVRVGLSVDEGDGETGATLASAETDDEGAYRFEGVPTGKWTVRSWAVGEDAIHLDVRRVDTYAVRDLVGKDK